MTGAIGDFIVPTILSSSLIIIFKEKSLSLRRKIVAEGEFLHPWEFYFSI